MPEKTTDSGGTRQGIGSEFIGNLIAVFRGLVFEDDAQQHWRKECCAYHHQQNRRLKARAEQP